MGLSTEQLIASTTLMLDLHDIAQMSAEERAEKLATYKAQVTELAAQEQQAIARVQPPNMPPLSHMLALSRVARKHRAAQRALARIERAITQEAERALRIDGLTLSSVSGLPDVRK